LRGGLNSKLGLFAHLVLLAKDSPKKCNPKNVWLAMSNLIDAAQQSAKQGDWGRLTHHLQQFVLSEDLSTLTAQDLDRVLFLAIAVLREGDFQNQWDIAKIFPGFGKAIIAPLIALLHEQTAADSARWFAARSLGNLHDPDAIQALVEVLETTEDEELSEIAADALANLGSPAIAAVSALLGSASTRLMATQTLAQIRHSETVPALLSVTQDDQSAVRNAALEALSSFSDVRVLAALKQALQDPVAAVRQVAISGLSLRANPATDRDVADLIAERLWDVDLDVCKQAAMALGRLGGTTAIAALLKVAQATTSPLLLQIDAIRSLGWIGTPPALEALQHCCETSPALPIQQELIAILGRWTDTTTVSQAAQWLVRQLHALSPAQTELQATIALALGQLQHPLALDPLTRLLASSNAKVQLHAIAALKRMQGDTAQYLIAMYHQPNQLEALRQGIKIALREWHIELPQET
jgi:HEAT repeat protein